MAGRAALFGATLAAAAILCAPERPHASPVDAQLVGQPAGAFGPDARLTLAACAARRLFLFDVYRIRLYLPDRHLADAQVFAPETPKAVRLLVTYSGDVPGGMPNSWRHRFSQTVPAETIGRLDAIYDRLRGGDELAIDYAPHAGSVVTLNGKVQFTDPGHALIHALLDIWMGPRALNREIHRQLQARRC